MKHLVFFLEGQSDKEMLEGLIPRWLDTIKKEIKCHYFFFKGKQDLRKKLSSRLKNWQLPESAFVVLLDQDRNDCKPLKTGILDQCRQAITSNTHFIVRIACRELESWYFGDFPALMKGLKSNNLFKYQNKQKYRYPDNIQYPSRELEKITKGMYQKISGSRAIGKHLSLSTNTSRSFQVFIKGLHKLFPEDV